MNYTPTTEDIYGAAAYGAVAATIEDGLVLDEAQFRVMFDRWLAAHDAEVAAKTVGDMADRFPDNEHDVGVKPAAVRKWLRFRAAEYREGSET